MFSMCVGVEAWYVCVRVCVRVCHVCVSTTGMMVVSWGKEPEEYEEN